MLVLHILNDGPTEDADSIIKEQMLNHKVKLVDLSRHEISYEQLVKLIEQYDRIFSW